MNHRRPFLLAMIFFLLAACGQPDAGTGGARATQTAGRAQATADPLADLQPSPFSLLPGVPAHPAMERMAATQVPEASVGLAGVTASGLVEIRTVELVGSTPKEVEGVLDFYVALLPTLGWEPVADYAAGTLYRRPGPQGGETGLFVSISAGARLVEMVLFEAKGALPPFAASHAGPDVLARDFEPQGVAYAQSGELYVAWERDQRIQRFDAAGEPLQEWGGPGAGPGQFGGEYDGPTGVAVGADGSVFVVDPGNGRIQKFSADGRFLASFGEEQLEPQKSYLGPNGIAAGPDGTIYLADSDTMMLFAPDGAFLRSWHARIPANSTFSSLDWLAVDDQGFVYATDGLADVVQKYAPDGTFVAEWGGPGVSPGRFSSPAGITVAGDRLYVVDGYRGRIQVFGRDGALLGMVGGKDGEPAFSGGAGIAVAPNGDLLVADHSASDLLLF
ncbi:MAG TPA: NHL repeat-containing protein, partial [Herpetosiphonaceae bacterium]